jgi:hypothetical protein
MYVVVGFKTTSPYLNEVFKKARFVSLKSQQHGSRIYELYLELIF